MKRSPFLLLAFVFALACNDQGPTTPNVEIDAVVAAGPNQDVWPNPPLHVDQANPALDPVPIWSSCGTPPNGTLQQTFTPTATTLPALDLHLRTLVESATVTINVRAGAGGAIIGTASTIATGPSVGDVRFAFMPPLSLEPGQAYAIEWLPNPPTAVTWGRVDSDTYAGGSVWGCSGNPTDYEIDFFFRTYRLGKGPSH